MTRIKEIRHLNRGKMVERNSEVLECLKQDLSIAKNVGDRAGEGLAYYNLGNTYCRLGDFNTAKEYYEQHLRIAKELSRRQGNGGKILWWSWQCSLSSR